MNITTLTPTEDDARILEIGPASKPQAYALWPDNEVEYFDLPADVCGWNYKDADFFDDKVIHRGNAKDLSEFLPYKFDIIFASHVLEHFPWWDTERILTDWVSCLNPGGALHILVPALEWTAEEALKDAPSKAIMPHTHGGIAYEGDVHMASFTMRYLRARMEGVGLAVIHARSGQYEIWAYTGADNEHNGREQFLADQHYCVGILMEDIPVYPPAKE